MSARHYGRPRPYRTRATHRDPRPIIRANMGAAIAALLAGGLIGLWISPARGLDNAPTLPPCANEDGSGSVLPCYWDAQTMGNGRGDSFMIDPAGRFHYTAGGAR